MEEERDADICASGRHSVASLTERLAQCYTGAVHDVLRLMGYANVALPPDIKAIAPGTRLAGPVWTVSGHIDRNKTRHETLLGWCTLLAKAPAGHVVVCQPNNHEIALMGELSAQTLHAELGQIVAGLKPGRQSDGETHLFWHRGLSLSDIALGAFMLEKAGRMQLGQRLRFR